MLTGTPRTTAPLAGLLLSWIAIAPMASMPTPLIALAFQPAEHKVLLRSFSTDEAHRTGSDINAPERLSRALQVPGLGDVKKNPRQESYKPGVLSSDKGYLQVAAANLSAVRSMATDLALLVVLSLFTWAVVVEFRRKIVLIAPIEVPKDLADKGYTPHVLAQRLVEEIYALRREAKLKVRLEDGYELSAAQVDFTVPAASISFRSIIRYSRQLFHRLGREQYIQGEIVSNIDSPVLVAEMSAPLDKPFHMILRTRLGPVTAQCATASSNDLSAMLQEAAIEAARLVDPYLTATYWYWREQRGGRFEFDRTIAAVKQLFLQADVSEHHRAYVLLGNIYRVKRDFVAAEKQYASAARLSPMSPQAYNGLGNLRRAMREFDGAAAMYWRALMRDPRSAVVWSNLGYVFNDRFMYRRASFLFRLAMWLDPRYTPAYSGWGYALWCMGRYEDAETALNRAIDLDPDLGWPYLNLARLLRDQGRIDDALRAVTDAVKCGPVQVDALSLWGDILVNLKRYAEADEKYGQANSVVPRRANGYVGQAFSRSRQNQYEDSVQVSKLAFAIDSYYASALWRWGDALRSLRRYEEASQKYHALLKLDRYQPNAYIGLGQIHCAQRRPQDAIKYFRRAIAVDPRSAWAWQSWGQALLDMHHYETAESKFRKALNLSPRNAAVHVGLGDVLWARGAPLDALASYRSAWAVDASSEQALRRLISALFDLGRIDEALETLEHAVAARPGDLTLILVRIDVLQRFGRVSEALRQIEEMTSADQRRPEVLRRWASALPASAEGRQQAIRFLARAVVAQPNNERTVADFGFALDRAGLVEPALNWFDRAHRMMPESVVILLAWAAVLRSKARSHASQADAGELLAEAVGKLLRASELSPWETAARRQHASLLREGGDIHEAIEMLAQAVESDRADWRAWAGCGDIFFQLQRYDYAEAAYQKASVFQPYNQPLLVGLADAMRRLGKRDNAARLLQKVLSINPQNTSASSLLTQACREVGK
jgi:tetratricopeptide (TPR) repeat protein